MIRSAHQVADFSVYVMIRSALRVALWVPKPGSLEHAVTLTQHCYFKWARPRSWVPFRSNWLFQQLLKLCWNFVEFVETLLKLCWNFFNTSFFSTGVLYFGVQKRGMSSNNCACHYVFCDFFNVCTHSTHTHAHTHTHTHTMSFVVEFVFQVILPYTAGLADMGRGIIQTSSSQRSVWNCETLFNSGVLIGGSRRGICFIVETFCWNFVELVETLLNICWNFFNIQQIFNSCWNRISEELQYGFINLGCEVSLH